MLIDSHAHVISGDTARYPPAPLSGTLRAGSLDDPMTAERLLAAMDAAGVTRAALVQRAHVYGYDNAYVVDAAAAHPDRFAAICVIDADAADAGDTARHWLDRGAAGIRITEPAREAAPSWLDGPAARDVWVAVAAAGASLSVQLYRWNRDTCLPRLPAMLDAFPQLSVTVEHLSNFVESDAPPDHGVDPLLDALAAYPGVALKLTTINLARMAAAGIAATAVLRRVTGRFGTGQVMWGSDVGQSPQTYAEMIALLDAVVAPLADAERDDLFGRAALPLIGD